MSYKSFLQTVCCRRLSKNNVNAASRRSTQSLSYAALKDIHEKNIGPTQIPYYKSPLFIKKGYMQHLWDSEGKKYLDLFGGIVTVSVGHCHPKVTGAAIEQLRTLWHTTSIYMTEPMHEYAAKLTKTLPKHLKVVYMVNSGSEANDMAMTLARLYTGNLDIVSLRNGYHGTSNLVSGVTSLSSFRNKLTVSNIHQAINPDVYRGPWGGLHCRDSPVQTVRSCSCSAGKCEASDHYFQQLKDVYDHSIPVNGAAAFIAESIQGVGGTVQFPKGYLKKAANLVKQRGGLFIADEVQTGFGRTGEHFWGFSGHDVQPDIVTMAKGMGNGFPMAACVTTPEIAQSLNRALHFNTFGGNPVAGRVASAVLDVIEEEKLQSNCATVGTYMIQELSKLKQRTAHIGDVRGKGLMIGIELVADKDTRKPLDLDTMNKIFEATKDHGILIGRGGLHKNVLRIKPPMCITKTDVDQAMEVFESVFKNY